MSDQTRADRHLPGLVWTKTVLIRTTFSVTSKLECLKWKNFRHWLDTVLNSLKIQSDNSIWCEDRLLAGRVGQSDLMYKVKETKASWQGGGDKLSLPAGHHLLLSDPNRWLCLWYLYRPVCRSADSVSSVYNSAIQVPKWHHRSVL